MRRQSFTHTPIHTHAWQAQIHDTPPILCCRRRIAAPHPNHLGLSASSSARSSFSGTALAAAAASGPALAALPSPGDTAAFPPFLAPLMNSSWVWYFWRSARALRSTLDSSR